MFILSPAVSTDMSDIRSHKWHDYRSVSPLVHIRVQSRDWMCSQRGRGVNAARGYCCNNRPEHKEVMTCVRFNEIK